MVESQARRDRPDDGMRAVRARRPGAGARRTGRRERAGERHRVGRVVHMGMAGPAVAAVVRPRVHGHRPPLLLRARRRAGLGVDHAWRDRGDRALARRVPGVQVLHRPVHRLQRDLRHDRRRHRPAAVALRLGHGDSRRRGTERRNRARVAARQGAGPEERAGQARARHARTARLLRASPGAHERRRGAPRRRRHARRQQRSACGHLGGGAAGAWHRSIRGSGPSAHRHGR